MVVITLVMVGGLALGALIQGRRLGDRLCRASAPAQKGGTAALLFCVGVSLGANPAFWESLRTAGPAGAALAVGGIAGSVLLGFLVSKSLPDREDPP